MKHDIDNKKSWELRSIEYKNDIRGVLYKSMSESINKYFDEWQKKFVIENIEDSDKKIRILDIGCGYGRLSMAVLDAKRNLDIEIIGIDISDNYLKLYKENTHHEAFYGEIENIPRDIEKFDYIICVTVLMYVEKDKIPQAIINLTEHLAPKGKIILIENDISSRPFLSILKIGAIFKRQKRVYTRNNYLNIEKIKNYFEANNYKFEKQERLPFTTFFIAFIVIIAKLFNASFTNQIIFHIKNADRKLKKRILPSIFIGSIISKAK